MSDPSFEAFREQHVPFPHDFSTTKFLTMLMLFQAHTVDEKLVSAAY